MAFVNVALIIILVMSPLIIPVCVTVANALTTRRGRSHPRAPQRPVE